MKRFFGVVLCFILVISIVGCSTLHSRQETKDTQAVHDSDQLTSDPDDTTFTPSYGMGDQGYTTHAYMEYMSFEDACKLATDVVIATFIGARPYGTSYQEYSFVVKENLLGEASGQIDVYAMDIDVIVENEAVKSYNEQQLFLEHNTDYLLVLYHSASVYDEVDVYQFICNIVIEVSNPSNSKMYNQAITQHSAEFDFSSMDSNATVTYVKDLVKNNEPSMKRMEKSSLEDIIFASTDVLLISVDKCDKTVINDFRNTGFYSCTVIESLKGSVVTGETVEVLFRNIDVVEGDVIIVALNNYDNATYYRLTTIDSIFDANVKDTILSVLEKS
ncbi:MAG: hypothetical protein IIX86_05210 [Clostridia bacterium]|nr:hypothetical protein [Clostridia bacterium]